MIEVEGLTKFFGAVQALKGISFKVEKGQILGFLGPNGAGKSTAMRIIACYFPPSAGRASVGGFDCVRDSLEVRRRLGYMPEGIPLYPEMRVEEYLRYRAALKGVPRRDRTSFVNDAMDKSGIHDVRKKVIGQLSKGYRQRVGLADALVSKPEYLILDEPTIGLDPAQIRQTRQIIADLAGRHTVILSTHILSEVEMICSHVVVINEGQIAASGSIKELSKTHEREAKIIVVVEAPPDVLVEALSKVPGVARIEPTAGGRPGAVTAVVEPAPGCNPRGDIVRCIAARGWNLLELRTQALTLEEIFVKVVRGGEA